ncbi:MAG: DUF4910 domain-containing protein [Bacteroidales bacterium]|jgi:aminopeptidase-like protein
MDRIGENMYSWAKDLFPINRSITGPGVRETLDYLSRLIPDLRILSIPTGTKVFDWVVPDEWSVRDAYIADEKGERIIDFKKNNLHLVGYSEAIDIWLELDELEPFLYSIPTQPDAIPYITSYYKKRWGFCISHNERQALPVGRYHVFIDSDLKPGVLNYGEVVLPGHESNEVLLSTYICHPSLANNELSGPVVTTALVQWLKGLKNRRYTYRICFIPETIGSLVYLSCNAKHMKEKTIAGFILTCVGDNRTYSLMPSRKGGTLADRVANYVLDTEVKEYVQYSFLDRGSDERQYCSPLIDLPVVSVMRTKYGKYPEYHTSLDNMELISPEGLFGGFSVNQKCIIVLEHNYKYIVTLIGEPKMDKRGLRSSLGATKKLDKSVKEMMDFYMYCDGETDLLQISQITGINFFRCAEIADNFSEMGLVERTGR